MLTEETIQFLRRLIELLLNLAETLLAFLDRAALRLSVDLLALDIGGELGQPRFEPRPFLFQLNLLRRQLFEPHDVALLLQVERVDLVASAGELLHRGEGFRLRLPQRLGLTIRFRLDLLKRLTFFLKRGALLFERGVRGGETFGDAGQLFLRRGGALLGFGNLGQRLEVLLLQFLEALFVELDARLMAFALGLELHALLLRGGDLMLQRRELFAKLENLVLTAQDVGGARLDLVAKLLGGRLTLGDLGLQHVELMSSELRVEMLQLRGDLFVSARLAGLTLQRTNLPLHLSNEIGDAQQVLVGVLQLAEGFFLLRLELRDARRFLEHHPAILRLAGEQLRDVALRHHAVTRAPDARAHEELLDVFEPARRFVDEILAPAIPEHPPRHRHLVVAHGHARSGELLLIHIADGQGNFGHAQRFAAIRAVEDAVRHLAAAQGFGGLLAQHPANGVRHIGLAAPIGADDGRHAGLEIQRCFVREGLKPKNGQVL